MNPANHSFESTFPGTISTVSFSYENYSYQNVRLFSHHQQQQQPLQPTTSSAIMNAEYFSCEKGCNKRYRTRTSCKTHEKDAHCPSVCVRLYGIQVQVERHETGEFQCPAEDCQVVNSLASNFRKHVKTHGMFEMPMINSYI